MRIFYSLEVFFPHISGVTITTERLASNFALNGDEVFIITASDSGDFLIEDSEKSYKVVKIKSYKSPIGQKTKVSYFAKLKAKEIIEKFEPDIIHLQDPLFISLSLASEAKERGIPVILTQHSSMDFPLSYLGLPRFFKTWTRKIIELYYQSFFNKYCDLIISPSNFIKEEIENLKVNVPIEVISNGIDLSIIEKTKINEDFLEKYQLKDIIHKPIVLYVGRLSKEKNIETLIKVIPLVLKETEAIFLFVGEGNLKKKIISELKKQSLIEKTRFISTVEPNQEDIYRFYKISSLFVMPSPIEAQSLATMEAMACGLPIVASKTGALKELVRDKENGLLVDPFNVEELAQAIGELLKNQKLKEEMGRKSKTFIASHDFSLIFPKIKKIYEDLVKKNFWEK